MNTILLAGTSLAMLLAMTPAGRANDWPQWRGPQRDGNQIETSPLADQWPASGIKRLWDSEEIPADDDGGFGSPIVVGGKVYVSVVWHRDVETETRAIDDLVMRQIGGLFIEIGRTHRVHRL